MFKTPQDLDDKINSYFEWADLTETPYTIERMAVHIGCDVDTICNYSHKDKYVGVVKKAKDRILSKAVEGLQTKQQVAGTIFYLKNRYGFRDKQELDTTSNISISVVTYANGQRSKGKAQDKDKDDAA